MLADDILYFLRRWLWLIVLAAFAGATLAYFGTALAPRVYQATAMAFVTGSGASLGLADTTGALPPDRVVATYAELLKSRPIVEAALSAAGTPVDYDTAVRFIDVVARRDAQLIQVSARAGDPSLAAGISNQLVLAANQQTRATQRDRLLAARTRLADLAEQRAAQLAEATRQVNDALARPVDPSRDNDLGRAQAELAQAQQSSAAAVRSLQDLEVTAARDDDALSLVEPAVPVFSPAEPRVTLTVLIGGLTGLILGFCAAVLSHAVFDSLPIPQGVVRVTGLRLLGAVVRTSQPPTLDALAHGGLVEPFRRVRTLVQAHLEPAAGGTVLVSGNDEKTGTSAVAAGLAIAFAHAGDQVILVDANLAKPRLRELFAIQAQKGLTDLLAKPQTSARDVLTETSVLGLRLLGIGQPCPDTRDMLASSNMRRYVAELRGSADVVVIDGPPVSTSEGAALTAVADAIVLVLDARRIRGRELRAVTTRLTQFGVAVSGFVLNDVRPGRHLAGVAVPVAPEPSPQTG